MRKQMRIISLVAQHNVKCSGLNLPSAASSTVQYTSNSRALVSSLLIQGIFNQAVLQLENNLSSQCRHRLVKKGANPLLCMDLGKIMKHQKCSASINCFHHTQWLHALSVTHLRPISSMQMYLKRSHVKLKENLNNVIFHPKNMQMARLGS